MVLSSSFITSGRMWAHITRRSTCLTSSEVYVKTWLTGEESAYLAPRRCPTIRRGVKIGFPLLSGRNFYWLTEVMHADECSQCCLVCHLTSQAATIVELGAHHTLTLPLLHTNHAGSLACHQVNRNCTFSRHLLRPTLNRHLMRPASLCVRKGDHGLDTGDLIFS